MTGKHRKANKVTPRKAKEKTAEQRNAEADTEQNPNLKAGVEALLGKDRRKKK